MVLVIPSDPDGSSIITAVRMVRRGGVVAYPTETFYGLGADIRNQQALDKIYAIKGRSLDKPIPIIIGSREELPRFAQVITPAAEILMDRFWPGGLTLLFRAASDLPNRLTAGTGKIGIRLSSNPIAILLAQNLSGAITATSANQSGEQECTSAREVISHLSDTVDVVIDGGRTPGGAGSTIVDTTADPPVVIREGVIPSSEIHRQVKTAQRP